MNESVRIDGTDLDILEILRQDGRATIRSISEALDIPESTARDRIRALEDRGAIEGYRANVDPRRVGLRILAWLIVEVPREEVHEFARFMDSQPGVLRGYQLNHRPNAFALKISSPTTQRLTAALQTWRKNFDLKTIDLLLVDDVRLADDEESAVDEKAYGALDERLIA
jgi:Lrp/AsnC family leucine-responsive transcriptional regulator